MSKLSPVNDFFLVEIEQEPWAGGMTAEEGIRKGKVVEISDFVTAYGMHTFAFEGSLMNEELLRRIHDKYSEWVGKRVFWPDKYEAGTVLQHEGKQYAFLKWSSIMAIEDIK